MFRQRTTHLLLGGLFIVVAVLGLVGLQSTTDCLEHCHGGDRASAAEEQREAAQGIACQHTEACGGGALIDSAVPVIAALPHAESSVSPVRPDEAATSVAVDSGTSQFEPGRLFRPPRFID